MSRPECILIFLYYSHDGTLVSAVIIKLLSFCQLLIGYSLTSREHASGYMRRPYEGHGVGCLWPPKPKTGSD